MLRLRKISSAVLSIVLLLSSMSFTLSMHLCRGSVESWALLTEAAPCVMQSEAMCAIPHKDTEQLGKMPCCADRQLSIKAQSEMKPAVSVSVDGPEFILLPAPVNHHTYQPVQIQLSIRRHLPPLIERDIPILVQSLII